MKSESTRNIKLILIAVILLGAFFRFYKLDWGQGLFTHPDEYHIVISANQLSFPTQMHPHFFSYGTVTIYLIYFTKLLLSMLNSQFSTLNLFLVGRLYSALFSTITIFFIFKISLFFVNKHYALVAAALATLTPGLIQQAHFATPESNLIFSLFGALLFMLYFVKTAKLKYLILSSIFSGLAFGIKVSSIAFLAPIMLGILLRFYPNILKFIQHGLFSLLISLITLTIVAPFIFLDFPAFWNNIAYEGKLAQGELPVFYTRQFINTIPFIFQLEKILPFALGPIFLIAGFIGLAIMLYFILKSSILNPKSSHSVYYLLLISSFLSLFVTNGFLFAKWTRFLSPTFPFFAIFASFGLWQFSQHIKSKSVSLTLNSLFLLLTLFWTLAFFSIYQNPDVRITASDWLLANTSPSSKFLVEGGNMVDIPISNVNKISLDFYNLENDPQVRQQIISALENSDYFLIQSRRVFSNHQRLPDFFPTTAKFYSALFDGSLGFEQIKEFTSYPKIPIFNLDIPDENAEETWSVFDHPVIRVFKKKIPYTAVQYAKFLGN